MFDDIVVDIVDDRGLGKVLGIVHQDLQFRLVYVSLTNRAKGAARADFVTHREACLRESPLNDLIARRAILP